MHPHTYVHVQVRGLLEDVRDDAATSFKALLWLALGTAGLVMTLVLVGQGGDGHSFFAYKADLQAMQKFNQVRPACCRRAGRKCGTRLLFVDLAQKWLEIASNESVRVYHLT